MMPGIGGYTRYSVDTHDVTLPSIEGKRQYASKVWDELKSQKPGQFDPVDKTALMIPADDLLVKTVSHLSDGGSLAGKQPLELFLPLRASHRRRRGSRRTADQRGADQKERDATHFGLLTNSRFARPHWRLSS